jgi:hypothetical protein
MLLVRIIEHFLPKEAIAQWAKIRQIWSPCLPAPVGSRQFLVSAIRFWEACLQIPSRGFSVAVKMQKTTS